MPKLKRSFKRNLYKGKRDKKKKYVYDGAKGPILSQATINIANRKKNKKK